MRKFLFLVFFIVFVGNAFAQKPYSIYGKSDYVFKQAVKKFPKAVYGSNPPDLKLEIVFNQFDELDTNETLDFLYPITAKFLVTLSIIEYWENEKNSPKIETARIITAVENLAAFSDLTVLSEMDRELLEELLGIINEGDTPLTLRSWTKQNLDPMLEWLPQRTAVLNQELAQLQAQRQTLVAKIDQTRTEQASMDKQFYEYEDNSTVKEAMKLLFDDKFERLNQSLEEVDQQIKNHQSNIQNAQAIPTKINQKAWKPYLDVLKDQKETIDRMVKNSNRHFQMLQEGGISVKTIQDIYQEREDMIKFQSLDIQIQKAIEVGEQNLTSY